MNSISKTVEDKFIEMSEYWGVKLEGSTNNLEFQTINNNSKDIGKAQINIEIELDKSPKLVELSEGKDTKLYINLLSLFKVILYKYFTCSEIIVGSPHYKSESDLGYSRNKLLPLRDFLRDNDLLIDTISKVRQTAIDGYINQQVPVEDIFGKDQKKMPVFSKVILLLEGIHAKESISEVIQSDENELTYVFNKKDDSIFCTIYYHKNIHLNLIENINRCYLWLIQNLPQLLNEKLSQISLSPLEELKELPKGFNETAFPISSWTGIHELVEKTTKEYPNHIALRMENEFLTYKELNEKANQLARTLRKKGVERNSFIGLMLPNSMELIIGILGIIKAGGAYVPIDPQLPKNRIKYILNNCAAKLLLTGENIPKGIDFTGEIINLYDRTNFQGETSNLDHINKPTDLVYMYYTSGTTGNPKGVMIRHESLVNYILWSKETYVRGQEEVFAMYSSISFDLSVTTYFTSLITGNEIVVYQEDSNEYVIDRIIRENRFTILKLTPAHLSLIKEKPKESEMDKIFIVGGESLKTRLARNVYEKFYGKIRIFNEYGPTEATVGCMSYEYKYNHESNTTVPIGKPIQNTKILLLDRNLHKVPVGVAGEIFIIGKGIFQGYLNNSQLTEEKLIKLPDGEVAYKSGDIGRLSFDGELEYIGRQDRQVKIKGVRIELEEIENTILEDNRIEECSVLKHSNKEREDFLCAFIVTKKELAINQLKNYLLSRLPHYMIPASFILVDEIPLNINGKVDKDKLIETYDNLNHYVPPSSEMEVLVARLWKDILGVENIGINDNFFQIGGDSIKGITFKAKLQDLGFKIELRDIFENPSILELSSQIKKHSKSIDQKEIRGTANLLPIQNWYLRQTKSLNSNYNQWVLLEMERKIDIDKVQHVFDKIMEHHDVLRMRFKYYHNEIIQEDLPYKKQMYLIEEIQVNENYSLERQLDSHLQYRFDLENGPLVKLVVLRSLDRDSLCIIINHSVIDVVSWRIILEDFHSLYFAQWDKKLPDKTNSYMDWAKILKNYAVSKEHKNNYSYWGKYVNYTKEDATVELGKDTGDQHIITDKLTITQTEKLLRTANRAFQTQVEDILMTALGLSIKKFINNNKVKIFLEGHGREVFQDKIDISRTVGWFTTIYPVYLHMPNNVNSSTMLKEVKETLRNIPNKGLDYGVMKYLNTNGENTIDRIGGTEGPEFIFNYLGQVDLLDIGEALQIKSYGTNVDKVLTKNDENKINFSAEIIDNMLNISVAFNSKWDGMNTLLINFISSLNELINICCERVERGIIENTPSDVSEEKISIEEMEMIGAMLEDIKRK
ncbi:non-ribosomal peptide synthetase [Bacillus pseudomycoides]|uniref:non-ribosomal peptide synthetase n=1 Tax=Bacillus TaxID=1386 RepID=UPI000380DC2F|nr:MULTISPECIES: non-ribosomal peptide synthetase [Bacillus]PDX99234.1 non-ribosomal peptide synthetase [Bacillus pseudomycoides]PEK80748.1 non-ribosomal peptide synthetase [Bacillus pseudomycoides]PEN08108.1 non-ribosomal peptide synthetase [Bacillus pseudomycoides]PGB87549.1 non-ribosomal peptide synthetase [Bacillus pseudomycoides]PGS04523.1 non-ribosomal peptide synthetase [Bacillus pseudomycoides]